MPTQAQGKDGLAQPRRSTAEAEEAAGMDSPWGHPRTCCGGRSLRQQLAGLSTQMKE